MDKPVFIDDPQCREIYPETVQAILDSAGLVRIELCVYRWTREQPILPDRMVPVGRIVLPVGLAIPLRDQLTNLIEGLQKQAELAQAVPALATKN